MSISFSPAVLCKTKIVLNGGIGGIGNDISYETIPAHPLGDAAVQVFQKADTVPE